MKKLIKLLFILMIAYPLAGITLSACSEESDCSMTGRPMVYARIYTYDRENNRVLNDTLDSLTVTAFGTDSVIINNQKQVHDIALPLRYTSDSTILVFHYNRLLRDTMLIMQENTAYFESMDCGYSMKQNIRSITPLGYTEANEKKYNSIDSLYIQSNAANINGTENLKIFYRYYR